jgi:hypothetical protein
MKTILTCLLGLAVSAVFGQDGQKKSDAVKDNLRGRVKSVVETLYDRQQSAASSAPGGILEKRETKFNGQGKITESTLSSWVMKNQGETFLHKIFEYDKDGQPITCTNIKEYGLTMIDSFTCDGQGNIVMQMRYGANHTLVSKKVNLFDEKGRLLLESDFDVAGANFTLTSETETTYFDMEHQREIKTRRPTGVFEDALTSFDEKGRIARVQLLDKAKNTIKEWDWTFDNFDNMVTVEERVDGIAKDTTRYTYEYDKAGNWVKRTEFVSGKPSKVTERVIGYY